LTDTKLKFALSLVQSLLTNNNAAPTKNPVFGLMLQITGGADVVVVILLLSPSKAFMLSASKPPANCTKSKNQISNFLVK
jgi:hypothetical protein